MREGKRPGGLTALAVLNFVFGGLGALGLIALFALLKVEDPEGRRAAEEISKHPDAGLIWINILLSTVAVALMIASGVGYLGQKRFLGRTLGNAYALVSIASSILGVVVVGVDITTIIGLVYPVLTLALINTTFKDDLVN